MKIFSKTKKISLATISVLFFIAAGFLGAFFAIRKMQPQTIEDVTVASGQGGQEVRENFGEAPLVTPVKTDNGYLIVDDMQSDLQVQYADQSQKTRGQGELKVTLPKTSDKPIVVDLPGGRSISITDKNTSSQRASLVRGGDGQQWMQLSRGKNSSWAPPEANIVKYESGDGRKTVLYGYQRDQAGGEHQLKNWIMYAEGSGTETERYQIQNAKIKIDADGNALLYFDDGKQEQNRQVMADVPQSLIERAQKAIQADVGADILNQDQQPDFIIPRPYYIDKNDTRIELKWEFDGQDNSISVSVDAKPEDYPLALDPTLQFTLPTGVLNNVATSTLTGDTGSDFFGKSLAAGDFNADGRIDLAVSAYGNSSYAGRAYVFYNAGSVPGTPAGADVIISGSAGYYFGVSMISGDFNADGVTDLAVSGYGRVHIFNGGSMTATMAASSANTIITSLGGAYFGISMTPGDFNADGKIDLAVGAYDYAAPASNTGRAFIFYNDGSYPATADGADVIISGEATNNYFGYSLASGDFNTDGKTDLAVGAYGYSSNAGRAYLFYNDGSMPTAAASADAIFTGESSSQFGYSLASGDFNADNRTDLAVGATIYSTNTGRAYLFYNDGSMPTTAATADVIITGQATNSTLGFWLTSGDFNADGKTDLAVGAPSYSSSTGRVYVFYGGFLSGTMAATSANIIINGGAGEGLGSYIVSGDFNADGKTDLAVSGANRVSWYYGKEFQRASGSDRITGERNGSLGSSLVSGDFNFDGKTDLAVGAATYSSNTGRTYLFYNDGSLPTTAATADVIITGEASSQFGSSLVSGDFNADGKTDLAVGANAYSSSTGRTYIFYNDGSIPTTAASADVIITGETSSQFGSSLVAGDFNADGKNDLAIGGANYSSGTGRTYIFYNDGSMPTTAATADAIMTGEASSYFGAALASGDFNADGKTDLIIGATSYSSNTGRVYLFYNDGSMPTTAATADVIITGEVSSYLGAALVGGDFNADGKTDLAVGATAYSSTAGRTYIFYNDGSLPTTAATADVIITGEVSSQFGSSLASGDFNADGKTDLAVGANAYSGSTGRTYIFYNDGSMTTTAASADVIITGEVSSSFGSSLTVGDFNANGKNDLVVGARGYFASAGRVYVFYSQSGQVNTNKTITSEAAGANFGDSLVAGDFNDDGRMDLAARGYYGDGRVYIFYNDGSFPSTAAGADVIITAEAGSASFGRSFAAGDFNADGKTDLAIGSPGYSSGKGAAYIFNGSTSRAGTIAAISADVKITGNTGEALGAALAAGDFNRDGKTDLAVGATDDYASLIGRVYIFNGGSMSTAMTFAAANVTIAGGLAYLQFGYSLTSGDFNADGRIDLGVGTSTASGYGNGHAYVFYNDGSMPTTAATADVIITGEDNGFGRTLTSGDFNADGKADLAVGSESYSTNTGRAYIFNGGNMTSSMTVASASTTMTGEAGSRFGYSLAPGDFNVDGKVDLAVGAYTYSSSAGAVYLFYNDGSLPTTAATADISVKGEAGSQFGQGLAAGDFNVDGKTDLAIGAVTVSSGSIYFYESQDSYAWQVQPKPYYTPRISGAMGQEAIIVGEKSSGLGYSMTSGDFNADGKTDLAVGAYGYSSTTGRVYIFYNDGSIPTSTSSADNIITGEATASYFGISLTSGDFNADGKTDLAVGAYGYSSSAGRSYIFYNDGSFPTNAASADVAISGETNSYFGNSLVAGDFNADGKTDLAVGAHVYSSNIGRTYLFYNDGSMPTTAASADTIITGEGGYFGTSLASGDLNADGRVDLVVGAYGYASNTGKAYVFYNDGTIPTSAGSADVIITGEKTNNIFGYALATGDFNADGRTDLVVGAYGYTSSTGRTYIFYNDGSLPTTAATADVIITGEEGYFGISLASGDFNADGKADLVVSAYGYASSTGRVYIFYNDGSIPATAATADVIITGEANSSFGKSLAVGDFNMDGKVDLAVGAYGYMSNRGKVYIYVGKMLPVSGFAGSHFGNSMVAGDFNADGQTDLAVGASFYSSNTGRVYIFYNDGSVSPTVNSADVIIAGEAVNNSFGSSLASGDFNADGKTDLIVGASGYASGTGRIYLFYNDGSIPTTAATADVKIDGFGYKGFGSTVAAGDFNADGRVDLAASAPNDDYGLSPGTVYVFYNDGAYPNISTGADVKILGKDLDSFGMKISSGDLNGDGRTDLISTDGGTEVYVFANDGSLPTTAATADVTIVGEPSSSFGTSLAMGDFNADGKTDLAVGAASYSANTGRMYVFYNDGSIPTTAAAADITITGEADSFFGNSAASGDFNADGKTDLAVGAPYYAGNAGRTYIFYAKKNEIGKVWLNTEKYSFIDGMVAGDFFGNPLVVGDFSNDGIVDLAVGAVGSSGYAGSVYTYPMVAGPNEDKAPEIIRGTFKARGNIKAQ